MVWTKEKQKIVDARFRERRRARSLVEVPCYKHCNKCNVTKPATEFQRNKISRDGLSASCRLCTKIVEDIWKTNYWYKRLVSSCKSTAKKHHLRFDLDEEFVLSLWDKQGGKCYWFDIPMVPCGGTRTPTAPSLDRINCNEGYTKNNVVLCTQSANLGRCDISAEEYRKFVDLIKNSCRR